MSSTTFFQGMYRFAGLSRAERHLCMEAVVWLGLFQASLLLISFRRIAPYLGAHMAETPSREESPENREVAKDVALAVARASRRVPWKARCLVQAMAGKQMLNRRGIDTTLYLGLAKNANQSLQAHAWLRCGHKIILGGGGLKKFAIVSTFGCIGHDPKK